MSILGQWKVEWRVNQYPKGPSKRPTISGKQIVEISKIVNSAGEMTFGSIATSADPDPDPVSVTIPIIFFNNFNEFTGEMEVGDSWYFVSGRVENGRISGSASYDHPTSQDSGGQWGGPRP